MQPPHLPLPSPVVPIYGQSNVFVSLLSNFGTKAGSVEHMHSCQASGDYNAIPLFYSFLENDFDSKMEHEGSTALVYVRAQQWKLWR